MLWIGSCQNRGAMVIECLDFYQGGGRSGIKRPRTLIKWQVLMLARRGRCLVVSMVHTGSCFCAKGMIVEWAVLCPSVTVTEGHAAV